MEEILKSNIAEYLEQAQIAEKSKAYNSAVILYFKTITSLSDLFIYRKELLVPSNHTERFRILRKKYPALYALIDKDFLVYQESYRLRLTKEHMEVVKNDLKKIQQLTEIKINA